MPLPEVAEHAVAQRLEGRDDEDAAESGDLAEKVPVAQQVLDLRGEVKRQLRELVVQGARDPKRVRRAIQEVRVAERDVPRARRGLPPDVFQHHVLRDREETAAVNGGDRAVQAAVLAAPARLRVPDQRFGAVAHQPRILPERRKTRPQGGRKAQAPEEAGSRSSAPRHPGGRNLRAAIERLDQTDQRLLVLAADDVVRQRVEEVPGVQRGVEPVEADRAVAVDLAYPAPRARAQTQRRMHRDRDADEARLCDARFVQALDREVDHARRKPGALEKGGRPRQPLGLMPQLVAGQEQDRSGLPQVSGLHTPIITVCRPGANDTSPGLTMEGAANVGPELA